MSAAKAQSFSASRGGDRGGRSFALVDDGLQPATDRNVGPRLLVVGYPAEQAGAAGCSEHPLRLLSSCATGQSSASIFPIPCPPAQASRPTRSPADASSAKCILPAMTAEAMARGRPAPSRATYARFLVTSYPEEKGVCRDHARPEQRRGSTEARADGAAEACAPTVPDRHRICLKS